MNLKDITLPAFLWYILPGVNAVFLLIVVPVLVLDFDLAQRVLSWSSVMGYLMSALVIGFMMDSMKLYQFTFGYKQEKRAFFVKLAHAVDGDLMGPTENDEEAYHRGKLVFALLRLSTKVEKNTFPSWEHSRWVMVNHTSKVAFAAALVWGCLLFKLHSHEIQILAKYPLTHAEGLFVLIFFTVGFVLVGLRLAQQSRSVMRDANSTYVEFVSVNKGAIAGRIANIGGGDL